jgi:hypothetical protein
VDRRARLHPTDVRHPDIEQRDVRPHPRGQLDGLAPTGGQAHDIDAGIRGQQRRRALPHEPVIVGDDHSHED